MLTGLLLVGVAGMVAVGLAWRGDSEASAQMTHARRTIPNTDVSPYGANFFLMQEVEEWKSRKTLQMAREAGIVWAKQQFAWEEIQPRAPRQGEDPEKTYSWDKADKVVALFEEYGLGIIARLDRPPEWTKSSGLGFQGPPDDLTLYGDFVHAFVERYKGRVHFVQIWNEPNLWYEWGNRKPSPQEYAELLRLAYARAREADPNVYVLCAPLALTTEQSDRAVAETVYLEEMYRYGARNYFDILAANAFGFGWPPEDPASADKLNFLRVVAQREVMVRNGDANKAVWFNEFGWNASPDGFPPQWYVWQRVTEPNQAQYTARGIQMARDEWNWVGVLNIWYFRQVGTIAPDASEYYFRMLDVDFTPRLVYHRIKEMSANEGVASSGYFEETNPAVVSRGGWQLVRETRASGGSYLAATTPAATLSFAFRGQSLDMVVTRVPGGSQLHVTVDGREANLLPVNGSGQAVLDLNSSETRFQDQVKVASDLIQGAHTAQVTVMGDGAMTTPAPYPVATRAAATRRAGGIDALLVSGGGHDPTPYLESAAGLLFAAIAGAALLMRDLRQTRLAARDKSGGIGHE
jgi:polysaccharide biosynthesis protein PslG